MAISSTNLSYTNFLFVTLRRGGEAASAQLRTVGGMIGRGFFNDFDAEGNRDGHPHETIQFFVAAGDHHAESGIGAARYAVQVSGKYRPRLVEAEEELKRRLGDAAEVIGLMGAERAPRYTSAEMYEFAYQHASPRRSGRVAPTALILPINKSTEWWEQSALDRHAYFYPHVDAATGCPVHGHARVAQDGIPVLYRRLYHNPDGYDRQGEVDFITYFECADEHLETFERIHNALRDTARNPEWRYVREGPLWRGKRVLRW
jgi:hypothetical protein